MSETQYHCDVNGNIVTEKGCFFRAAAFSVTVEDCSYDILFEKNDSEKVVYRITSNGKTITELEHPDYVPSCAVEALPETLGTAHATALFAAMCHCGISIEKNYVDFFKAESAPSLTYSISQTALF